MKQFQYQGGLLTLRQFVEFGFTTENNNRNLIFRTCTKCNTDKLVRNPKDPMATQCHNCLNNK